MAREKLTKQAVEQALATLPGWTLAADGLSIARTFTFKNFSEAFGFMTRAALAAENLTITRTGRMSTRPSRSSSTRMTPAGSPSSISSWRGG